MAKLSPSHQITICVTHANPPPSPPNFGPQGTLLTPVSLCGENNSEILELLVQQGGVSGTAVLTSEGQEEQVGALEEKGEGHWMGKGRGTGRGMGGALVHASAG